MNRDDILRMARKAGWPDMAIDNLPGTQDMSRLERFAALVAAKKDKEIEQLRGEVAVLKEDNAAHTTRAYKAEAERYAAVNLNKEWEQKAATWMASPEAAQRLEGYREMGRKLAQLEAERDAAVKDAERYRWLKKENRSTYPSTTSACVTFNIGHDWVKESDLDAAIDAARGEA